MAAIAPDGSVVTRRARRRTRQQRPGATALGRRRPVGSTEGRRDGGADRRRFSPVRWRRLGELDVGVWRPACWQRNRRRRRYKTMASSGCPGIRAEATCASRRGGDRAWRVCRNQEGATADQAAASRGDGAGEASTSRQHRRAARRWGGSTTLQSGPVAAAGRAGRGRLASGVLAAESAAAALQDDGVQRASSLPLFPPTEFLAREFQGLSHGRMRRSHQNFILLSSFIKKTSTRYSFLSSLYRREKETDCPKGNPVIQRGFGPKIG